MESAAEALPVGANPELYWLDVASPEFQQALHARPSGFYAVALKAAYDTFVCGLPNQPESETRVRIVRDVDGGSLAACTCGAVMCWHVAAAWTVAAVHHDWPERHPVRWRWLRDCAVAKGRQNDAARFSKRLREYEASDLDLGLPSSGGAGVEHSQALSMSA